MSKISLILYVMFNNVKLIIMFYHDKLITISTGDSVC